MSVIVKGMKMPKNCDDCFFIGRGYPDWCSLPQISNGDDEIDYTKKRPDWCPLIELPEKHGRLIDADAFADFIMGTIKRQKYEILNTDDLLTVADVLEAVVSDLKGTGLDGFDNSPTIIEAEGGTT